MCLVLRTSGWVNGMKVSVAVQQTLRVLDLALPRGSQAVAYMRQLGPYSLATMQQPLISEGHCTPPLLLLFLSVQVDEIAGCSHHGVLSCLGLSWCLVMGSPPTTSGMGCH
eukprot:g20899.t1